MIEIDGKGGTQSEAQAKSVGGAAFGETLVSEITPVFQATATYNILPAAKFETFTATGGAATATGREFKCNSGTSVGGYGVIRGLRPIVYRAGEGLRAKFTARFPVTGIATSLQMAGLFNLTDTLSVGYDGTTFGLIHQYGGAADVRTLTVTGSTAGSDCDIEVNGVTTSGITLSSTNTATSAHEIAAALTADSNQAGYYFSQNGSTVVVMAASVGVKSGSFSVAGANITASWAANAAGVAKTKNTIAQTAWDNNPSWLDVTKGNVYQLSVPYLGYGNPRLFIMNPDSGAFELAHVLRWANANTEPLFTNPSLRVGNTAASLGSSGTDLQVFSGSFMGGIEGKLEADIPARALDVSQGSIDTTIESIVTIRPVRTFNSIAFAGEVLPIKISAVTDSSKGATIEIYKNSTFTSAQNFSYIEENESCVEQDNSNYASGSGWTPGNGTLVGTFLTGNTSSNSIDLAELGIYLTAGETLTVGAKVNSGAASSVTVTIDWLEDY
jgi:hypothetical protein